MMHISLFSGIGGFDLAAEWMGWTNIVSCEINFFGRKVLEYYWPNAYHHDDIYTLNYGTINAELTKRFGEGWRNRDIVLSGGFPCQPYSMAGKRLGKEDERHLWPQMRRVISEIKPTWIVGENVLGIVSWSDGLVFEEVQADMEAEGYEVQPYVLPACAVENAPHRRDRVWFVGHRNTLNGNTEDLRNPQVGEIFTKERGINRVPTPSEYVNMLLKTPSAMDSYSENLTKKEQRWPGLLPTPKKQNANQPAEHGQGGMDLQTFVQRVLLPTPTAGSDVKGGCTRPDPGRQNDTLAHAMHSATGGQPGTTSQLNPRFVAELMGFPPDWLELPFQSTGTNP